MTTSNPPDTHVLALRGLPVSIKDQVRVKGHHGATSWAYNLYADHIAAVVKIPGEAGAVLYLKAANPQTWLVSPLPAPFFHSRFNPSLLRPIVASTVQL